MKLIAEFLFLHFLAIQVQFMYCSCQDIAGFQDAVPASDTLVPVPVPDEEAPVKVPVGENDFRAYYAQQCTHIGQHLKLGGCECECGNRFKIMGLYLIRLIGQDKNIGTTASPRIGQNVTHITQINAYAHGGVSLTFEVLGNFSCFDISLGTNRPIACSGVLLGVRAFMMVSSESGMRVVISGRDLTLIKRKGCNYDCDGDCNVDCNRECKCDTTSVDESTITVHGIYGISIIIPCEKKDCRVNIHQLPAASGPPVDGSNVPVQLALTQIVKYCAKAANDLYFINSTDAVSYSENACIQGFIEVPPGQTTKCSTGLIMFGESITIKVPACYWKGVPVYECCTGQILFLTVQKPNMCYLMVVIAKPKSEREFEFVTDSSDITIKGAFGLHLIPTTSATCPSSCLTLPDTNVANQALECCS